MQKKFQTFVSSTYTDLIDERQDALKSVLDLGHIPSGMEGFFAADQEQLSYIEKIIDECDYYVLIIAGRYGSVDEHGISYTEREYDHAVSKKITVLAFVHSNISKLPKAKVDTDPNYIQRLETFKAKVSQRRVVSFWDNREQLKSSIIISLSKSVRESPAVGWVRGDAAASEEVLSQLNAFRNEVERLRIENAQFSEQLRPRVDNIAALSDLYPLRCTYFVDSGHDRKRSRIFHVSWEDIFKAIGPSFFSPDQQSTLEYCLKVCVSQLLGGSWPSSLAIVSADCDIIKIQLAAYGFMNIYSAQTVKGGMAEFMHLTDLGKRDIVEMTAVRASPATGRNAPPP